MPDWLPATLAVLLAVAGFAVYYGEMINAHTVHIRSAMSTVQDAVNALTDQLRKAHTEIVDKLADVQAQVDAAGVTDQVDLSGLAEVAQALDDIVPDTVLEAVADEAAVAAEEVVEVAEELEVADEVANEVGEPDPAA